ncbi:LIN1 transcriptase, partial [Crocuta crocuta]
SLYYIAVIIKTVWYWHKNRHIDQWNRIENSEVDPKVYSQLIFDKAGKNIQWKKDSLFNRWCWENWISFNYKWKLALQVEQRAGKESQDHLGETKAKINYWDHTKLQSFCTVKETINKTKRQSTERKKTSANDTSNKG